MVHRIEAKVKLAEISVEVDRGRESRLLVDGTVRAQRPLSAGSVRSAYLATTLQTEYEYHALVEAHVTECDGALDLRLAVDGREIAHRSVATGPDSTAQDGDSP